MQGGPKNIGASICASCLLSKDLEYFQKHGYATSITLTTRNIFIFSASDIQRVNGCASNETATAAHIRQGTISHAPPHVPKRDDVSNGSKRQEGSRASRGFVWGRRDVVHRNLAQRQMTDIEPTTASDRGSVRRTAIVPARRSTMKGSRWCDALHVRANVVEPGCRDWNWNLIARTRI